MSSPSDVRVLDSGFSLSQGLRDVVAYREVLGELVSRQVRIRYKQTVLGALWVFLQPLVYTAVLAAVFSRFVRFDTGGYPYAAFVLAVFPAWLFVARSVNEGTQSLLNERNVITKVYFPRLIVPMATLSSAAFDMLVSYVVVLPIIAYLTGSVSVRMLALPFVFGLLYLLALGIVSVTSPVNAIYRDVGLLVAFGVQIWVYLSPVLYPATAISGVWGLALSLNPLTGLLETIRWALLPGYVFPSVALGIAVAEIAVLLAVGPYVFARLESRVADRI